MYDKGPSGEGLYTELVRQARFEAGLLERVDDDRVHCIIDSILREKSRLIYIPIQDQVILKQRIFNALRRLDILQPLVDDPTITEIMINGRDEIFVERMGWVSRITLVRLGSSWKMSFR